MMLTAEKLNEGFNAKKNIGIGDKLGEILGSKLASIDVLGKFLGATEFFIVLN